MLVCLKNVHSWIWVKFLHSLVSRFSCTLSFFSLSNMTWKLPAHYCETSWFLQNERQMPWTSERCVLETAAFNELTLTDICSVCSVRWAGREKAGQDAGEAGSRAMCSVSRGRMWHGWECPVLGSGTWRGGRRHRCFWLSASGDEPAGILSTEKDSSPHKIERATGNGTKEEMLVAELQGCCMEVGRKKKTRKPVSDCQTRS